MVVEKGPTTLSHLLIRWLSLSLSPIFISLSPSATSSSGDYPYLYPLSLFPYLTILKTIIIFIFSYPLSLSPHHPQPPPHQVTIHIFISSLILILSLSHPSATSSSGIYLSLSPHQSLKEYQSLLIIRNNYSSGNYLLIRCLFLIFSPATIALWQNVANGHWSIFNLAIKVLGKKKIKKIIN